MLNQSAQNQMFTLRRKNVHFAPDFKPVLPLKKGVHFAPEKVFVFVLIWVFTFTGF